MYVEISGRRTGKSTRLVLEVMKQIAEGKNCIIFTPFNNSYMIKMLKDNLPVKTYEIERVNINRINIYSYNSFKVKEHGIYIRSVMLFYDEFSFMQPEDIIIQQKGYYVTTPNKVFTSVERMNPYEYSLLKVLHENKCW